jgi:hypothetical protein
MDFIEVIFWIALFGIDQVIIKHMKYTNMQLFMHYVLLLALSICLRKLSINNNYFKSIETNN